MTLDDYKTEAPIDEPENECAYCGKKCDGTFCNKDCEKAGLND